MSVSSLLKRLPAATLLCAAAACGLNTFRPEPCDVEAIVRRAAGDGAQDCGSAGATRDASVVHECTVAALDAGTPFFARFAFQGIDSTPFEYRLMNSNRDVKFYGGNTSTEGGEALNSMYASDCIGPSVITSDAGSSIACTSQTSPRRICSNKDLPTE